MEESRVCSSCGSRIAATAAFCTICGAKVEPAFAAPVEEVAANVAAAETVAETTAVQAEEAVQNAVTEANTVAETAAVQVEEAVQNAVTEANTAAETAAVQAEEAAQNAVTEANTVAENAAVQAEETVQNAVTEAATATENAATAAGSSIAAVAAATAASFENVTETVDNIAEESIKTMENTTQEVENNISSAVKPVEVPPAAPIEPATVQPAYVAPAPAVDSTPVTPVQTQPVTPAPVPTQPVGTPVGQPIPAQPVYAQPAYPQNAPIYPAPGYPQPGYGAPAQAPAPAPKKKKVGPLAYIFGSIVSLIEIVILFVLELIVVLRVGASDIQIESATSRGDLGSAFLNDIAKVLPSLSHYIFIGIVSALCLAFAVLIFVIFSKRSALAFRTLAIDMLIVSGIYAFGMLFINTYCGITGGFNIDSELMTLLRTTCSESVLLISLGLLCPAIIFFIVAGILDSVRYKKAVKANENK